jgi:3-oxoacid CoA-transferase subunit B
MEHANKHGQPKLLRRCTLPLTGARVVDLIITDLCVFACDKRGGSGLRLLELAPGVTLDDVNALTEASFSIFDAADAV